MDKVLSIRDLSIRIGDRVLMQNISFDVGEGEAVLLSGVNGIGKSTLLKSILRLETNMKTIKGEIIIRGHGDVLSLKHKDLEKCKSRIGYIEQRDRYAEMGNVTVRDVMRRPEESLSNKDVNDIIDNWLPTREYGKRMFDAKSKPVSFSGGEQRVLSVLSVVSRAMNVDLMLIDEPLNNLDYLNIKNISNMINKAFKSNPNMALLMISHCRIFPFITREIRLTPIGIKEVNEPYSCYNCLGEYNINGYY